MRIVSLVPSLTELLCELGLAQNIVGRTGYCIHPKDVLTKVPKVGGTKQLNHRKIKALSPTHVVLNRDENRLEDVEILAEYVPNLVVTHPCKLTDNLVLFRQLGAAFNCDNAATKLCEKFESEYGALQEWRVAKSPKQRKAMYLIWRDPWMTISHSTYIADFLSHANFETPTWPLQHRYPQVTESDVQAALVDVILFSSEPYSFTEDDLGATHTWASKDVPRRLIDGEMLSWYGPRSIQGMRYLRDFHDANF